VYSLNAPVPARVQKLVDELQPALVAFDRRRERPAIVVKRLGDGRPDALAERLRTAMTGTPAVEVRITGIDYFDVPTSGPGPVVFLNVESPGLHGLHRSLRDEFDTVDGVEGPDYRPHVTLARGGDVEDARRLADRDVDPIEWTVSELQFWDAHFEEVVRRIPLPA
jgi:2'-5' RNA ligase